MDLTKITGLAFLAEDGQRFPNAEIFAARLLTLPTCADFSKKDKKDIKEISAILKGMKH